MESKKLRKGENKVISGVCTGLGDYFSLDPVIVRVIFLIAFLGFGTGLLLYIILAIVMPAHDSVT